MAALALGGGVTAVALADPPGPTASFTYAPLLPQPDETITFTSTAVAGEGHAILVEEWDLDGDSIYETLGPSPTQAFADSGPHVVGLHVVDDHLQESFAQETVVVNRPPSASFTASPNPAASGEEVGFDASASSDLDGTIDKYEWDLDGAPGYEVDGGASATTSRTYSGADSITVGLRVTDNYGGTEETTRSLTIEALPTAAFTVAPNPALTGETVTFDATGSSDPDGTIDKYEWDVDGAGGFETDNGTDPTATQSYDSPQTITVRLRVTDDDGRTQVAADTLTIGNRLPGASFTVSPNPAATGQTVNFNGSASSDPDGSIAGYEWDLDGEPGYEVDGGASATTSRTYSGADSITVGLRVTDDDGGTQETTRSLTIEALPTASFTATPNPALTGQAVSFNASASSDSDGTIVSYQWDLDGNNSFETTEQDPTTTRVYSTARTITVRLRITDDDGRTAEASRTVTINNRAPTASFTASPNPAQTGQLVSFDGSESADPDGSIAKYEWDLDGNGSFETDTGTTDTSSRTYTSSGPVNVRLRVTDNLGATNQTTRVVNVGGQAPSASFTVTPPVVLTGQTVNFNGGASQDPDGSIARYEWDLDGAGGFELDSEGDATVSRSYTQAAALTVRLRVTDDDGNTNTTSRALTIEAPPTAAFTIAPNPALTGQSVLFDGSGSSDPDGSISLYEWDLDGGAAFVPTSSGPSPTAARAYNAPGPVSAKLRVTDDDGHISPVLTKTVTVDSRPPVPSFTIAPNPALTGQTVSFNGSASSDPDGTITKYEWDLDGNGSFELDSGTDATVSRSYSQASTPTVRLRVTDDDAGTSVTSLTLTVRAPPIPLFTIAPNPALTGQTVSFNGSASSDPDGTIAKYEWDLDGNGSFELDSGTQASASRVYAGAGTPAVRLRVTDNDGNTSTVSHTLTVRAPPIASFTMAPNPALINQPVTFDATASSDPDGTIAKYEWDLDGNGSYERDAGTSKTTTKSFPSPDSEIAIKLRVTDNHGNTSEAGPITLSINTRPVSASFTYAPPTPLSGDTVTFTSTSSVTGGDNEIAGLTWDLDGDGDYETDTGTTPTASRAYPAPGPVTVRLRVEDEFGNVGFFTLNPKLMIGNRPPSSSFTFAPAQPVAGQPVSFFSTATDPDTPVTGQLWDLNGDGAFGDASGAVVTQVFGSPASYTVGLLVTDSFGLSHSSFQTVVVSPPPAPITTSAASSSSRLMSPFPIVRIAGSITRKGTRLRRLTVTAPGGAIVTVRCRGRGCPFGRLSRVVDSSATASEPSARLVRIKRFERRLLRSGAVIKVFVSKIGTIGKYTRFQIRKGKPPARADLCLPPGSAKPVNCS